MNEKFLVEFLLIAFIMKIAGEFVHEVLGHGLFVILFGGRIIQIYLSILWPYELSYIRWSGNFENWQIICIEGAGIILCTAFSIVLQTLLLLGISNKYRFLTFSIFWLAFWTFLNPAGYLILGGISPFGDIAALIGMGVLTGSSSIIIGLLIFIGSFISISKSLCKILFRTEMLGELKALRFSLSLFWLIIPIFTFMHCLRAKQPFQCAGAAGVLSLLPVIIAFIAARMLCPKFHEEQ